MVLFVALRIYARLVVVRHFGADDCKSRDLQSPLVKTIGIYMWQLTKITPIVMISIAVVSYNELYHYQISGLTHSTVDLQHGFLRLYTTYVCV